MGMSEPTYLRAKKDQDLRFEVDDKTRHEGGKIKDYDKEFSYLAVMPTNIPLWLDELFPIVDDLDNEANLDASQRHRSSLAGSVHSMGKRPRHNSYAEYDEANASPPPSEVSSKQNGNQSKNKPNNRVPSAQMKQARDLAAKKARERRTYRASFYQPAPQKQPKASGDGSQQKNISMISNPMRSRQNL